MVQGYVYISKRNSILNENHFFCFDCWSILNHFDTQPLHLLGEKSNIWVFLKTTSKYLFLIGLKHISTVVFSYGPRWPWLGKQTRTWETLWATGQHVFILSSRAASVRLSRSVPWKTHCFFNIISATITTDYILHHLLQRASLTVSVPAALCWSRLTQSHDWGPLFLKTTFLTVDVPK